MPNEVTENSQRELIVNILTNKINKLFSTELSENPRYGMTYTYWQFAWPIQLLIFNSFPNTYK